MLGIESIWWYNTIVTESVFEIISFEKIKPMKEAGIYLKEAGKEIKALIVLNTIFAAVYIISSIQFNPENTEKVELFMTISAIVVGLTNFFLMYSIGKNLVDAGDKLLER